MTCRVKICCIGSVEEATTAIRHGACAIGLVSEMPSGPGVIPEERIAEVARYVPPGVTSVLLTSKRDVDSIVEQQRRCAVGAIQLTDRLLTGTLPDLRRALPGVGLIQVIHVTGPEAIEEAVTLAEHVDAILLDSGNPMAAIKSLGGTGRTHDWRISLAIREAVAVPLFLAGGLRPENVADAIRTVRPFGVDVCSGVRTEGALDEDRLLRFMNAVRRQTRR